MVYLGAKIRCINVKYYHVNIKVTFTTAVEIYPLLETMESHKVNNVTLNAHAVLKSCASTTNEGICRLTDMLDCTKIRYWMPHSYFEVF